MEKNQNDLHRHDAINRKIHSNQKKNVSFKLYGRFEASPEAHRCNFYCIYLEFDLVKRVKSQVDGAR